MRRLNRFLVAFFLVTVLILSVLGTSAANAPSLAGVQAIALGDQAYNQRFLIEADAPMAYLCAYKPYIERAIEHYALAVQDPIGLAIQSQSYVYNRLAQLHYEHAKVLILEGDKEGVIKGLLVAGKEYGFKSLKLQAGFERNRFVETLGLVWDAAALVWTADCWGTWLGYNPIEGLINLSKIKKMYERAIKIDEDFWDGSAHIGLGAILATSPSFMGGDLGEAKKHFERVLEINPNYLPAAVVYAESYGFTHSFGKRNGIRDQDLIVKLLTHVGEIPVGQERPFWNWEAKAEAQFLWAELERFSR